MQISAKKRMLSILLAIITIFSALTFGQNMFAAENPNSGNETIKNIIVMIPDGAGFGNFDMAEAVKLSGLGMSGLNTKITTDAIAGSTSEGLYLSNYLVGTSMTYSANSSVTDSAAGGTAIATGHKTNNGTVSLTPDTGTPIASLLEAAQIAGKSAGVVVTKFYYDATPAAFTAHATNRSNYNQITEQMLNHNLSILLGGGVAANYDGDITAKSLGYTVVKNKSELEKAVANGDSKIWSNFCNGRSDNLAMDYKMSSSKPTLLDMTKAAITVLSENTNNDNGFFLMIEGSMIDSGGHSSHAAQTTSEYLAFDEAFAYAVNWAMQDGHTLVVGVPDHDTGGLTPKDDAAEEAAIKTIASGHNASNIYWDGNGNHTGQNVPIWAYGPDEVVDQLLTAMGLPTEGGAENARTGKYYRGVKFNSNYAVQNTALAYGVAKVSGLDLDAATDELFVDITKTGKYSDGVFTVKKTGIKIPENANYYFLEDGTRVNFKYGVSVYTGGKFYVPQHVADADGTVPLYTWDNPFPDVSETDDYFEAVAFVHTNGLFLGTNTGFEPLTPMNRAMFVTVLGRLAKADVSTFTKSTFSDVDEGVWYTEYVGWASSNNIVSGSDGRFSPNDMITREQAMIIIYNYAKSLGKTTTMTTRLNYKDAGEIHDWAYNAVMYCSAYGLVSADENGEIRPTEYATRADVAELMMNFTNKIIK